MEACKASSLDEVMERVTHAEIRLDHGPFAKLSPEVHSLSAPSPSASLFACYAVASSFLTTLSDWVRMQMPPM